MCREEGDRGFERRLQHGQDKVTPGMGGAAEPRTSLPAPGYAPGPRGRSALAQSRGLCAPPRDSRDGGEPVTPGGLVQEGLGCVHTHTPQRCTCIHVHTLQHTRVHIRTHHTLHLHPRAHMHTPTHTCTHAHTTRYTCTHVHTCTHLHTCAHMHTTHTLHVHTMQIPDTHACYTCTHTCTPAHTCAHTAQCYTCTHVQITHVQTHVHMTHDTHTCLQITHVHTCACVQPHTEAHTNKQPNGPVVLCYLGEQGQPTV